ncbi:MAG: hypothetical protein WCQ96_05750 [Patescibacteria group bacterium]
MRKRQGSAQCSRSVKPFALPAMAAILDETLSKGRKNAQKVGWILLLFEKKQWWYRLDEQTKEYLSVKQPRA